MTFIPHISSLLREKIYFQGSDVVGRSSHKVRKIIGTILLSYTKSFLKTSGRSGNELAPKWMFKSSFLALSLHFSRTMMIRPVTLTCGHSACHICLQRLLEVEEQEGKTRAKCPECHTFFGRESLTVNFIIDKLTSKVEVACINRDCGWKAVLVEAEEHSKRCTKRAKMPCPLGCG